MESFLTLFEAMPAWQKLTWIVACLSLNWIIEGIVPLFRGGFHSWRHTRVNLFFLATTMAINVAFGLITVGVFEWTAAERIGLRYYVELPLWTELLGTILVLDLIAQYTVHYFLHKSRWMWRLHMVHHSDTHVDVTTGTRHHPLDFIIRETFAVAGVIITGAPVAWYVFYRVLTIFFTYMNHANVNLPMAADKALAWVFVSPHMHKFHHHDEMPWTDTNFGNMFSFWDRLFGTYMYANPKEVRYGLDVAENKEADNLRYQLQLPFDRSVVNRHSKKHDGSRA